MVNDEFRSGFVAVVGRPNVGKSTLVNGLLKTKVSIVTPKPQTTRHRVLGIKTKDRYQIILVDTPGLHDSEHRLINRTMNRMALAALEDADAIVFVVEALKWTPQDEVLLGHLRNSGRPAFVACNKIDRVKQKEKLLPFIQMLNEKLPGAEIVPISALKGEALDLLEQRLVTCLPVGEQLFPEDQVTDRSDDFFVAELIREKLTLRLQQELPYGITVAVEKIQWHEDGITINAVIWVERDSQKAIVIGKGGALLKEVGRAARLELKKKFNRPVHIELWTKVKDNWSDDARTLKSLGYEFK